MSSAANYFVMGPGANGGSTVAPMVVPMVEPTEAPTAVRLLTEGTSALAC